MDSSAIIIVPRPINRWIPHALVLLLVLSSSLLGARAGSLPRWLLTCAVGAAASLLLVAVAGRGRCGPKPAPGIITVTHGRVLVESSPSADLIVLSEITEGFFVPPDTVRLVARSGEALVLRTTRPEAERVLTAAGVNAARRVLHMRLAIPAAELRVGAAIGEITLAAAICLAFRRPSSASVMEMAAIGAILAIAAASARVFRKRSMKIGSDGLLLQAGFRRRFIPHATIRRTALDRVGVVVEERDGTLTTLRVDGALQERSALHAALLERINQAMALGSGSMGPPDPLSRLDSSDALLTRASFAGDYRTPACGVADLARLVEDPRAPAARRLSAAIAFRQIDPEAALACVMQAARACANEAFVKALRHAVEGAAGPPGRHGRARGAPSRSG